MKQDSTAERSRPIVFETTTFLQHLGSASFITNILLMVANVIMFNDVENPTFGSLGVSSFSESVFKMPANKCSMVTKGDINLKINKYNH